MNTHPETSSSLAERIARLSPAQRALLEKRLFDAQGPIPVADPTLRDPSAPIPLSSPQARLWLIQQLDPDTNLFNQATVWRLHGMLDLAALQKSLDTIVARHEPLRTGMQILDGQPAQVIHPPTPITLVLHDLRPLPSTPRDAEISRIVQEQTQRPFELATETLLRASVIQLGPEDNFLIFTRNHISHDAWSVAIFNRELVECYRAYCAGESPRLPELLSRYADFAIAQTERMRGAWFEQEMAFWREQLQDVPNLELANDHPRPPRLLYHGEQITIPLEAELVTGLHEMCRREGVTLYMLLLAAFEILLGRYAGQEDFAVGTNILGRDRVEYENLIGYFANVLALRADLSGELTFREFLKRTRKTVLDAFSHREVPFEKIIWDLHRPRDESRTPVFQVLFQTTQIDFRVTGLTGLEVTPIFFDPHTSEYEISLDVRDFGGKIECGFRYCTDLFNGATIERFAKHYTTVLRGILKNPDARIAGLTLLSESEHEQLVVEGNQTTAAFPRDKSIHQLVEIRAAESPDAVAAVLKQDSLTYRELNLRANQLAHYLQARGVGPDVRVAICMERSLDMLVTILGVLKAGGAYLPLEPNSPPERTQFIIKEANAAVVLTTAKVAHTFPPLPMPQVLIDQDRDLIARESAENPQSAVAPANLAYVIYTSGTTGQPKGVMIEHHSLVNHATFFARYYELSAQDRVLQFAPIAFDFAAEEIFPAWLTGAAVVVRPEREALAPREFLEFVAAHQLTVLDLPTAFWHTLVEGMTEYNLTLPACVRLVIVGGEKASAHLFEQWRTLVDDSVRWVNTYGPTEATIAVTTYEPRGAAGTVIELPIGRPIANTLLYILDAHMQPVPIGVVGDLYIGGEPVARGYLNQPELTAEKFVPNPFGASKLYKTGDLARYRADGQIEYRGRRDDQIKLRGFRIELGEIESALALHPQVQQSVVLLREDVSGDKRLVAYITAHGQAPETGELRAWLRSRLPDYMVPGTFVMLDALPLTAHGKVNRRALPAPEGIERETAGVFVAPRTQVEQLVAGIWADVLRVSRVGLTDDFFELGGHSLLATLAVARAEMALGQTIPLRSLFAHPTVEGWARVLEENVEVPITLIPPIIPIERERYRRVTPANDRVTDQAN